MLTVSKFLQLKVETAITIPNGATEGNANDVFMKTNNAATGGIFKIKSTHEFDNLQTVTETAKTVTTVINASDNHGLTNHGFVTGDAVTYTSSSAAGGLTTASSYFVIRMDDNNFKLATTHANAKAGTATNISVVMEMLPIHLHVRAEIQLEY